MILSYFSQTGWVNLFCQKSDVLAKYITLASDRYVTIESLTASVDDNITRIKLPYTGFNTLEKEYVILAEQMTSI